MITFLQIAQKRAGASFALILALFISIGASAQAPVVTSFSPSVVTMRSSVTIVGSRFTNATGVTFGGTAAVSYTVVSDTQIRAVVGSGTSGAVKVTNASGIGTGGNITYVTAAATPSTAAINQVITDFNGFWSSSATSTLASRQPDARHNMTAFSYNGTTYSTGVSDLMLVLNLVGFTSGDYRALPINAISGNTTGNANYLALGTKIDGDANASNYLSPSVSPLKVKDVLTDGLKGLDLGTGVTNISSSMLLEFSVSNVVHSAINDNKPDIVVTQIASPSDVVDIYAFTDANGNIVGKPVQSNLNSVTAIGTSKLDLFTLPTNTAYADAMPIDNGMQGTRDIRMIAFKLSDFGITTVNAGNIVKFKLMPGGDSDPAFIAYNAAAFLIPGPAIISQPVSQVVCPGILLDNATFTVVANGSGLTYQWKKNGVSIPGATSSSYTVWGVTAADYASYTVEVSNVSGSITSEPAFLNAVITTQPSPISTCLNGSAVLGTAAGGLNMTYRWYSNTANNNTTGTFTGITTATYSVPTNTVGTIYYYVIARANGGLACSGMTSNAVPVIVSPLSVGGTISSAQTICSGTTAILSVSGSTGTIQWEQSANGSSGWTTVTGGSGGTTSNYTTAGLTSNTYFRAALTSGTCSSAYSGNVLVTITPVSNPGTVSVNQTICNNTPVTVSVSGNNGTIQWQQSDNGTTWINISGAVSASYTSGNLTTNKFFRVGVKNGVCATVYSAAIPVTLNNSNHWIGAVSTDWNTAANWSCNRIPNASIDAYIPQVVTGFYPILNTGIGTCRNLNVSENASVIIKNSGILEIAGLINSSGTINTIDGSVHFIGNMAQTIPYNVFQSNTIKNLEINNPTTVNMLTALDLTGILNLKAGILYTGDQLTLKSNANTTAVIAPVSGEVIGEMTIERYIPAKRAYRFLSSPTTGGTIRSNWQESCVLPDSAGWGTDITGVGGLANGFDVSGSNNASLFTYINNNGTGGTPWTAATSTNVPLVAGIPYRVMVRGDRTINQSSNSAAANATTLRTTGMIKTGNVQLTDLNPILNGFSLVGNPYQAAVNMVSVLTNSPTMDHNFYYVWDPTRNTRGAYVTVLLASNTNTCNGSSADKFLQPGQACFVKTAVAGSPSLMFKEEYKNVSTATAPIFRQSNSNVSQMRFTLYEENALVTNQPSSDGFIINFDPTFSNSYDTKDAVKFTNQDENAGLMQSNKVLSYESRNLPLGEDIIPISLTQYRNTNYAFKVDATGLTRVAYLHDKYLNIKTELINDGETTIYFNVNTTILPSITNNRFDIVFGESLLENNEKVFAGTVKIFPNPIVDNSFVIALPQNTEEVKVKLINTIGQVIYATTQNAIDNSVTIQPENVLQQGVYMVVIADGKNSVTKKIIVK